MQLALVKAQKQAEDLPLARQIQVTKDFVDRVRKRMLAADEKIRVAQVALQEAMDEKRLVWDGDQDVPPEVRIAANLIRTLATRVGAVPHGGVMPGTIRRQRWSSLNVLLMWEAARQDETCLLVEWLI